MILLETPLSFLCKSLSVLALAHLLVLGELGDGEVWGLRLHRLAKSFLLGTLPCLLNTLQRPVAVGVVEALGDGLLVWILEFDGEGLRDHARPCLGEGKGLNLGHRPRLACVVRCHVVCVTRRRKLPQPLDHLTHLGDVAYEACDELVLDVLLVKDAAPLLLHPLVERLRVEDEREPHKHLLVVLREDKLAEHWHAHILEAEQCEVAEDHVQVIVLP
mmetsp:Transcript_14386/g.35156  ORF Transcript_14386/g.35156 Transcript_14386/m.35156 type:complete len:217 (+) Transcript_14386:1608-2258(+)